jgi:hypothetical protein
MVNISELLINIVKVAPPKALLEGTELVKSVVRRLA